MRTLVILTVLLVMALGFVGCGPKDSHQLYSERMYRLSWEADSRSMADDVQYILMQDRPSRLSIFYQE